MRFVRRLAFVPALVVAVGVAWAASTSVATAYTPSVTMLDNDAPTPNQGIDPGQNHWGYGPSELIVKKGEQVTFYNPPTNKRPHSVTSISLGTTPFENGLVAGAKFDSSPSRETLVTPGNSWVLDTATVDPGNYAYYCRIHPWMVAKLTVLPE
ncbi:MAG: cupredoxin domain-containing protein [Chloroflexi bacterium]|nr:cupredoxin domain-containing protein [Chloroflexota bacterium]